MKKKDFAHNGRDYDDWAYAMIDGLLCDETDDSDIMHEIQKTEDLYADVRKLVCEISSIYRETFETKVLPHYEDDEDIDTDIVDECIYDVEMELSYPNLGGERSQKILDEVKAIVEKFRGITA